MMDSSIPPVSSAIEQLDTDSNLFMGLVGGGVAMLVGAAIWGAVTYFTEYQIAWMAIGVGFLVGFAVRLLGKGHAAIFGISSAVLSLIGCLLGNFLFYMGVIAREQNASFLEVLFFFIVTPGALIELFTLAFDFMDLLFYGLAAYVGFKTALDVPQTGQPQVRS
ncbi:MAG: hypothetical protein H7Y59_11345 [Anaerolineales bacterium]|nr:hypothetical protein [Anaerolineales bacterium]